MTVRLAYLLSGAAGPDHGVFAKVRTQLRVWAEHGIEGRVFARTDPVSARHWSEIGASVETAPGRRPWRRFAARARLISAARAWQPDVVYLRQTAWSPDLERLLRDVPSVLEINSDDYAEAAFLSPVKRAFVRRTRDRLTGRAAGLTFVSEELRRSPRFRSARAPSIVVPNSIDLASVAPAAWEEHEGIRLVFVGYWSGRVWHGLDRLASLARARPAWRFEVVGTWRDDQQFDPPENMRFHGPLPRDAYRHLLARADAAVGSLALFRNGMAEASPLKVREYLASGLPVIVAYRDSHFPEGAPFLLSLPNDETDLAARADEVDRFLAAWRGRRVPRADVAAIDATENEARRAAFLRAVRSHVRG